MAHPPVTRQTRPLTSKRLAAENLELSDIVRLRKEGWRDEMSCALRRLVAFRTQIPFKWRGTRLDVLTFSPE
jgi:hypothetical protein